VTGEGEIERKSGKEGRPLGFMEGWLMFGEVVCSHTEPSIEIARELPVRFTLSTRNPSRPVLPSLRTLVGSCLGLEDFSLDLRLGSTRPELSTVIRFEARHEGRLFSAFQPSRKPPPCHSFIGG